MVDAKASYAPSVTRHVLQKKGVDAKSGKPIVVPYSRVMEHAARRAVRTIQNAVSTSTGDLNSIKRVQFVVNENTAHLVKDCVLRFRISCSGGTARLVPTPYLTTRVIFRDRGTDNDLQFVYPEVLMQYLASEQNQTLKQWGAKLGFNPRTLWKGEVISAGESRYLYLPLPAWWGAAGAHIDLSEDIAASQEIILETTGVPISDTISGSPVISLDELVLMADSEVPTQADKYAHQEVLAKSVPELQYLDSMQVTYPGQALVAGTQYNFKLDQLRHKSAAMLLALVPTNATMANFARMRYASLDGAGVNAGTLDIIGPSGELLLGVGSSSPPAEYLRSIILPRWNSDIGGMQLPFYCIPFTTDLDEALRGALKGWFPFDGSSFSIRFQTPSAGTNAVVSFVQSATADAGTLKLGWTDPVSGLTSFTNELAFNSSAAALKSAFEALESVVQAKIFVTFNQAFSAGATVTMTITGLNGEAVALGGNLPLFVSKLTNTGANTTCAISESTHGVPGFFAATYDVLIYSMYYRTIRKQPKRISVPMNL